MGKKNPRENKFTSFLRIFLPVFLSVIFAFGPLLTQAWATVSQIHELPTVSRAELNLSDKKEFNFQNQFLRGDVEFFYNQWIVTEPENKTQSVYYQTPGHWSRRNYDEFGLLTSAGYASYRYTITGLTPGIALYAFRNIEVPNRIFLNGVLCSSIGVPEKEAQISFVDLASEYVGHIIVPSNGVVAYVMEVGNAGDGGASHIGSVYVEGHTIVDFSNRIIAPIALGFILASLVTLFFFVALSQDRWRSLLLVGMTASVGASYIFSLDSITIGMGLLYSGPVFSSMMVVMISALLVLLVLYGYYRQNCILSVSETIGQSVGIGSAALFYAFLHGTGYSWIALAILATFPLYFFIRSLVLTSRDRPDPQFMVLSAMIFGYCVLLPFFDSDLLQTPLINIPTIFSVVITATIFACGFRDIYLSAVTKRDKAVLERRYRNISNRALARLASEGETIATLQMIGDSYDKSIKTGDKKLLGFSTLMRRRLIALRQDKISFAEECELESQLCDLRGSISHKETPLLLDIEEGKFQVPPLLFETAIDELSSQVFEDDYITLWESKRAVGLSYPSRCYISEAVVKSISERCDINGLHVRFRRGGIVISVEGKR